MSFVVDSFKFNLNNRVVDLSSTSEAASLLGGDSGRSVLGSCSQDGEDGGDEEQDQLNQDQSSTQSNQVGDSDVSTVLVALVSGTDEVVS